MISLLLASCEKEKTQIVDVSLDSPFVVSLGLSSRVVNLDTSSNSVVTRLPDGSYAVSDTAFAAVSDPSGPGNVRSVTYSLFAPGQSGSFIRGDMQHIGMTDTTALYNAGFSFNLRRPDIGAFLIEVQAENPSNRESNILIASLIITRNNIRPRLFNLSAPDTLTRPTSGKRPVFFAVSAFDSDGPGDIATVFFRSLNSTNPNFEFKLYDDGNRAVTGDSIAGDGRYSLIIAIDSTATLGTKEFRFWARDKSLALSDSLARFITIVPSLQ